MYIKDNMKLQLKEGELETVGTSDFYYDLFSGGYIEPEDYLEEISAKKVREAINIINQYESLLEDNNLIEEM